MSNALAFHDVTFDVKIINNAIYLASVQLAQALDYQSEDAISRIYRRNADEFTADMSQTVTLTVSGNYQKTVRLFSLRGAHLVVMFSRTEVAKEFRKWVLDVLDKEVERVDCRVTGPLTEEMQESLNRLIKNGAKRLPFEKQTAAVFKQWNDLSDHFGVPYKEIPAAQYPEVVSLITRLQSEWELVDEPTPESRNQHEDSHYSNVMALCNMAMLSFERWPLISGALYRLNRDLGAKIASPITEGDMLARMVLKQFGQEIKAVQNRELPCNRRNGMPAAQFLARLS